MLICFKQPGFQCKIYHYLDIVIPEVCLMNLILPHFQMFYHHALYLEIFQLAKEGKHRHCLPYIHKATWKMCMNDVFAWNWVTTFSSKPRDNKRKPIHHCNFLSSELFLYGNWINSSTFNCRIINNEHTVDTINSTNSWKKDYICNQDKTLLHFLPSS